MDARTPSTHCEHASPIKCQFVLPPDVDDECCYFGSTQSLLADEHYRGSSRGGQRQDLGKVAIKSNNHSIVCCSMSKDVNVRSIAHADLSNMHHVPAAFPESSDGSNGKPLIEQDPPHAASMCRSMVPSTVAAAKASAC